MLTCVVWESTGSLTLSATNAAMLSAVVAPGEILFCGAGVKMNNGWLFPKIRGDNPVHHRPLRRALSCSSSLIELASDQSTG